VLSEVARATVGHGATPPAPAAEQEASPPQVAAGVTAAEPKA
jgi:hypothetical protein